VPRSPEDLSVLITLLPDLSDQRVALVAVEVDEEVDVVAAEVDLVTVEVCLGLLQSPASILHTTNVDIQVAEVAEVVVASVIVDEVLPEVAVVDLPIVVDLVTSRARSRLFKSRHRIEDCMPVNTAAQIFLRRRVLTCGSLALWVVGS